MNQLRYLGLFAINAAGPLGERITGNTPAHTIYSGSHGQVVDADPAHVTVRFTDGSVESYAFVPATKFGYLGQAWQQQKTHPGPSRLVPGAEVSVGWVLRSRKKQADRVTIWVATPE